MNNILWVVHLLRNFQLTFCILICIGHFPKIDFIIPLALNFFLKISAHSSPILVLRYKEIMLDLINCESF